MLSKRYESTEVDRRTWLHVPSGTHWSTSSDTHQVVEIKIETSTKMAYARNWIQLIFSTIPRLAVRLFKIWFCHIGTEWYLRLKVKTVLPPFENTTRLGRIYLDLTFYWCWISGASTSGFYFGQTIQRCQGLWFYRYNESTISDNKIRQ